jgi:histidine ammonia-lyase
MSELDGLSLTLEALDRVARGGEEVALAGAVEPRLTASRAVIERALAKGQPVYGVNTGFGELKNRHVEAADLARLQLNLLRSHAAGVGPRSRFPRRGRSGSCARTRWRSAFRACGSSSYAACWNY